MALQTTALREKMTLNLILIPTALENGEEITTLRSQKNDQNSNSLIHSYRVIDFLESGNTAAHNLYLEANAASVNLYNCSVMNSGGAA